MDSRTKIVSAPDAVAALAADPLLLPVRLSLDPLYAPHIPHLESLARPLLVVIAHHPQPYLSPQARAEMAASLRCVRFVVAEDIPLPGLTDLTAQESAWRASLEQTVLAKQKLLPPAEA